MCGSGVSWEVSTQENATSRASGFRLCLAVCVSCVGFSAFGIAHLI